MPGIENFAPERTDTSSGFSVEPSVAPAAFSSLLAGARPSRLSMSGGSLPLLLVIEVAGVGGDGEPGRHRQAGVGHLGEAGALAAERVLHRAVAVGLAVAEEVDELLRAARRLSSRLSSSPSTFFTASSVRFLAMSCSTDSCRNNFGNIGQTEGSDAPDAFIRNEAAPATTSGRRPSPGHRRRTWRRWARTSRPRRTPAR